MKKSIFVVDKFYSNPNDVRDFALELEFKSSNKNDGFNGLLAVAPIATKTKLMKKIAKLINCDLIYEQKHQADFKILKKAHFDKKTSIVHFDPAEWSAVLCLSRPDIIRGSTSFWRHKKLDIDGLHDHEKLANICREKKCTVSDIIKIIDEDSANMSKWAEIGRIGHIYNRIILFRGYMFHSASEGFGRTLEGSKLSQTFFFSEAHGNQFNCEKGWKFASAK